FPNRRYFSSCVARSLPLNYMRVIRPKSSPKMIRAAIHRHAYAGVVLTNTAPIPALLNTWAEGPAGPVLTWYGLGSERVELTGTVLTNWVTKATNLLQEEADATPGVRVGLDLPPHWRTLVWALAVWNCGAEVVFPTGPGDFSASGAVDVQVSAAPDAAVPPADAPAQASPSSSDTPTAPVRIAVALPALARQVDDLPPGAIDGAAELMAQPDVLVFPPEWDPQAPARPDVLPEESGKASGPGAAPAPASPSSSDTPTAPVRIAVALPALARQVADLPPGAIDGAAELMAQPDVLVFPPEWDPQAPALPDVLHGKLGESNGHGGLGSGEIDSGEIGAREAIGTSETSSGETSSGEI